MSKNKTIHCPDCGAVTVKGFCAACRLQVENIKAHKVETVEPYPTSGVDPKYWWIIPSLVATYGIIQIVVHWIKNLLT